MFLLLLVKESTTVHRSNDTVLASRMANTMSTGRRLTKAAPIVVDKLHVFRDSLWPPRFLHEIEGGSLFPIIATAGTKDSWVHFNAALFAAGSSVHGQISQSKRHAPIADGTQRSVPEYDACWHPFKEAIP